MNRLNLKTLEPRLIMLPELKLVAKCASMSFAHDKTVDLWKKFSPLISSISHKADNNKYSIQIYPDNKFFENFEPTSLFQKYAGVKVHEYENVPDSLEQLIIPAGQYAVFTYIGKPSEASETFRYILLDWLPKSQYILDDRPHLAIMGEKYKGEHAESEEELLLPVKLEI